MTQKNIDILPNTLVPIEIRVEIYKKAIDIIKKGDRKYGLSPFGLCLLLPCILWNLDHYCDDAPNGDCYNYNDTKNMFPELTESRLKIIRTINYENEELTDKARINALRGMIKQAESKIQEDLIKEITDLL